MDRWTDRPMDWREDVGEALGHHLPLGEAGGEEMGTQGWESGARLVSPVFQTLWALNLDDTSK